MNVACLSKNFAAGICLSVVRYTESLYLYSAGRTPNDCATMKKTILVVSAAAATLPLFVA